MTRPTDEQEAILDASTETKEDLCISALAGTGKSTTLRMLERASRQKPILYLAFNKKIVDDIAYKHNAKPEDAAKRMTSTTTVKTFNGLGHGIWSQTIGQNLVLDAKKSLSIWKEIMDELPKAHRNAAWEVHWPVMEGVFLAKALGHVPEGKFPNAKRLITPDAFHARLDERPDDLTADLIDLVLFRSIQAAYKGKIDFNDQVYLPAIFGGRFPQFPLVYVDEAQDLNPVNHEMLARLCVKSRIMIVGDDAQSIYGFRGAVAGGMAKLREHHCMSSMGLSISFRCPSAIVEEARWRAPEFKWIKEGGHVESLPQLESHAIADDATIICRNNAPLFGLAFRLLSSGRSVSVAGSDIGPKLLGILRRLGDESLSRSASLGLVADWEAQKLDKGSTTAHDMAACMRVFLEHGDSLGQAIRYAEHLFAQQGTIRLMTGHKAKGLEFPVVYFLDPWLCDPKDPQDQNLRYVCITRSMDKLFYLNSTDIKW